MVEFGPNSRAMRGQGGQATTASEAYNGDMGGEPANFSEYDIEGGVSEDALEEFDGLF